MEQLLIGVVIIVAILLICRCAYSKTKEGYRTGGINGSRLKGVRWVQYPGWLSRGGNIIQYPHYANNPDWLTKKCLNMPGCKGFTSDGWLKNRIMPKNRWTRVSNKDATYIRA